MLTGSCTAPFIYWSSSTFAIVPGFAWNVSFSDGFANGKNSFLLHVRAVRGGHPAGIVVKIGPTGKLFIITVYLA